MVHSQSTLKAGKSHRRTSSALLTPLPLTRIRIPALTVPRPQHGALPQILLNDILHGTHIVFRLPKPAHTNVSKHPPHPLQNPPFGTKETRNPHPHIPHIIQPRPPRPLRPPLHDLNALDIRTIDLKPHLDAHARQLVAQQDPRIHAAPADVQTHARERVAVPQPHEQDVAHLGGFGVGAGEEFGARAGGVEEGQLVGGEGGDGVFVG